MSSLDPIFAAHPHMAPAPTGYYQSAAYLRDEIAGLEGDIETWQENIEQNMLVIPRLEKQLLLDQIDVANAKIKIMDLKAKLQAKTGGAA